MKVTNSFRHRLNLLFESLELRLIHARYPFDRGPLHALSQECLDHFHLSLDFTLLLTFC